MRKATVVPALKREIGFADLLLFYVVSGLSVRWIATAAAAGPSTLFIWCFACVGFFIPLAATVLELSSRYPQEGGLYVWIRLAFGDFAGFLSAWTYWMCNLPYFPAILYFGAGSALFAFGARGEKLASSPGYFMLFALVWLAAITLLNIRGIGFGKWLNNLGALGALVPISLLLALAAVSALRFGSATRFTATNLLPHADLRNAIFWSTIFFAFGGCEAGSFMGEEIKNPRRTIPRALLLSGALLTLGYLSGTTAMLVALPSEQISGVSGFVSAIQLLCARLHVEWLAVCIAALVAVSSIGAAAAFLSSTSRLPFVAGIDRYLPAVFGRVHPRWRTPWVAVATYGLAGMLFALLGQAGTSVRGAYDLLVSMSIITYFIPYAFLFAAMIRLQREEVPAGAIRVPGGKPVAIALASVGLLSTLATILLSIVPGPEETNKPLAVAKVLFSTFLLVSAGVAVFRLGRSRARESR